MGGTTYKNFLINPLTAFFDKLAEKWESPEVTRRLANLLILTFFISLVVIELGRQNLLPVFIGVKIPTNHFYAVRLTFDLLLVIEVLGLIFILKDSVAKAMGKQFEILSLILLRQAFKEFINFSEPIGWNDNPEAVLHILSDTAGALFIFVLTGIYYRLQTHRKITKKGEDYAGFVTAKKLIALTLLIVFIVAGSYSGWLQIFDGEKTSFFAYFYTILVFSDILLVLISLRYSSAYHIVFRNSGFAISTVLIRLALAAPVFYNSLLGNAAVLLAVGLTFTYNSYLPVLNGDKKPV